jgi:hypothetical protein
VRAFPHGDLDALASLLAEDQGRFSQVSGDRTDLLEVRYHLSYAGRFQPSLGELAQARKAVDRSESVTALIHTRKALLLAEDASREEPSTSLEQLLASHVDERHAKAYAGIAGRIKEFGNIQARTVTAMFPASRSCLRFGRPRAFWSSLRHFSPGGSN